MLTIWVLSGCNFSPMHFNHSSKNVWTCSMTFNEVIWKFSKLRCERYWILSNLTGPWLQNKAIAPKVTSCTYFQRQQTLDGSSIADFSFQWSMLARTRPLNIHKGPFYFAIVGTFVFLHFHNWLKYTNWAMTKSHALEAYVCLPKRIL